MKHKLLAALVSLIPFYACPSILLAEGVDANESELSEIVVSAVRVANDRPAGTYSALATTLRFDPQTELQSRGLAEGQSDVTVQGGVFENTGFVVGAVTVMDPQTGHYMAELPVDPAYLSAPDILVGIDNALGGFNANLASVAYSLSKLDTGGDVLLGAGTDNLQFLSLRLAKTKTLASEAEFGAALSVASSRGDGTLPDGDHEFERYNLRFQHSDSTSRSDLVLSYQDKFYGWPGAYTGFASLPETDHTKTALVLANHYHATQLGWWEAGAYYRNLDDDYDFDRTTPDAGGRGSFEHETKVAAVGIRGSIEKGLVDWRFAAQLTADDLVRSTDIINAPFSERTYLRLSLVPSMQFDQGNGRSINLRVGRDIRCLQSGQQRRVAADRGDLSQDNGKRQSLFRN